MQLNKKHEACQYKKTVGKADAKNAFAFNLHLGSAGRMHSIEQKTTFSKAEKYSRKTIMQGGTAMAYKTIRNKIGRIVLAGTVSASMALTALGTAGLWTVAAQEIVSESESEEAEENASESESGAAKEVYQDASDGGHAIEADGEEAEYTGITVTKTGEAEGDEADFYGENAAIFATNGATLTIEGSTVQTDGTHANGVFSYGEGTTVNVSDTTIETSGNCSGGLMTTGGGTMNAENLTIHTTGNSSAAIRSDRGGGTVNVTGGTYTTDGKGSPVIYSTADITVSDADMTSTSSQGVVVEGKNSVTLLNSDLTADNNSKNSDKSDWYQAVMIYQSMSGDADEGEAAFSMDSGSLTNKNGDVFFVNNTVATITLSDVAITNEDEEGVFLRAAAAGWGNEGSNGGHVTLQAQDQMISGDLLVDEVSSLNLYLHGNSDMESAVNSEGEAGQVYVEIDDGAVWTLTGDSYITALTCDEDAVDLNGYKLYVSGEEYKEGTASEGEAIKVEVSSGSGRGEKPGAPKDGKGGLGEDGRGGPRGDGKGGPGKGGKGGPGGMNDEDWEGGADSNGERPSAPPDGNGLEGSFQDENGNPPEPSEGVGGERPEFPAESMDDQIELTEEQSTTNN